MENPQEGHDDLNQKLVIEADKIIRKAEEEDIILRLMGSIAFRIHCPRYVHYLDSLTRTLTDVDFASYSSERSKVENLLEELGYTTQCYVQVAIATLGRSMYWKKDDTRIKVDIFWDKLKMNHDIDFSGRLELEKSTLPLSELLQEKLQIVNLNLKDVKDTTVLLLEHDIAEKSTDREVIDLSPILERVSKDWCYYYTFSKNLKTIQEMLRGLETLSDEEKSVVNDRILSVLDAFEKVPKSLGWKARARIGTRKKWYNEVE